MRVTIRLKLLIGFLLILALLVLTGGVAIFKMTGIGEKAEGIDSNSVPSMMVLSDMNKDLAGVDRMLSRYLFAADKESSLQLESKLNAVLASIHQNRESYGAMQMSDEERKMYEQFSVEWEQYETQVKSIMEVGRSDVEAGNALLRITEPILSQTETTLYNLTEYNRQHVNQ